MFAENYSPQMFFKKTTDMGEMLEWQKEFRRVSFDLFMGFAEDDKNKELKKN